MSGGLLGGMVFWLASVAAAAPADYSSPNSLLGISGGWPIVLSVRGEAWLGAAGSLELGVGAPLATADAWLDGGAAGTPPTLDAAVRWRPGALCIGCGEAVMATIGVGLGSTVTPGQGWRGPWTWALGPDVVATGVVWVAPTMGVHASVRLGAGPQWVGDALREPDLTGWAFGTLGLAF